MRKRKIPKNWKEDIKNCNRIMAIKNKSQSRKNSFSVVASGEKEESRKNFSFFSLKSDRILI